MTVTTTEPGTGPGTHRTPMAVVPGRRQKVRRQAWLFMGLAHVLTLKQYLKGALFAAVELAFLASLPLIASNLVNLVTLGEEACPAGTMETAQVTALRQENGHFTAAPAVYRRFPPPPPKFFFLHFSPN